MLNLQEFAEHIPTLLTLANKIPLLIYQTQPAGSFAFLTVKYTPSLLVGNNSKKPLTLSSQLFFAFTEEICLFEYEIREALKNYKIQLRPLFKHSSVHFCLNI